MPPPTRDLEVLAAVEAGEIVSQLKLSQRVGIAVGLVNALLRRAIRKGLVKVRSAPGKRYAYYLTPKGFSEKSRLVVEYLGVSLQFFRETRAQYLELLQSARRQGLQRIVIVGAGEFAEIAALAGSEAEVDFLAVVDGKCERTRLFGIPVVRSLGELGDIDLAIVADHQAPQQCYDNLVRKLGPERVRAPGCLRISVYERGQADRQRRGEVA